MNVVLLQGNLCADPGLFRTRTGRPKLAFKLAVDRDARRPAKRSNGAQRGADYVPVVAYGRSAPTRTCDGARLTAYAPATSSPTRTAPSSKPAGNKPIRAPSKRDIYPAVEALFELSNEEQEKGEYRLGLAMRLWQAMVKRNTGRTTGQSCLTSAVHSHGLIGGYDLEQMPLNYDGTKRFWR